MKSTHLSAYSAKRSASIARATTSPAEDGQTHPQHHGDPPLRVDPERERQQHGRCDQASDEYGDLNDGPVAALELLDDLAPDVARGHAEGTE
jgi:hypothetical protein